MITVNVGLGKETEYVRNIIRNKALAELLEDRNVNGITLELSPEVLKELSQETMNHIIEDANDKSAMIVKSRIQIEGKIMDCEIVSKI